MQALPLDSLIGKPVTVYKDGKRREVGTITSAIFKDDHIQIGAGVTDEELLGTLRSGSRTSLKAVRTSVQTG